MLELEKILNDLNPHFKNKLYIENNVILNSEDGNMGLFIQDNKLISNYKFSREDWDDYKEYDNLLEYKLRFNIEPSFEDIKDWVESLKLDYVSIQGGYMIYMYKSRKPYDIVIEYYVNGTIAVDLYNYQCILFENLSMINLYQILKLKIENINKNSK